MNRKILVALLMAVVCLSAFLFPSGGLADESGKTFKVSMAFVESKSGQPVAEVECLVVNRDTPGSIVTVRIGKDGSGSVDLREGRYDVLYMKPGFIPDYMKDVQAEDFECFRLLDVKGDLDVKVELLSCKGLLVTIKGAPAGSIVGGSALVHAHGDPEDWIYEGGFNGYVMSKGRMFIPIEKFDPPGGKTLDPQKEYDVQVSLDRIGSLSFDSEPVMIETVLPKKFKGIHKIKSVRLPRS